MDRFDLENHISNLHSIVDSLNDISFGILEENITRDEAVNAIDGLAVMTKLKIEKLFDVFTQVFEFDQYNSTKQHDCREYKYDHDINEWV